MLPRDEREEGLNVCFDCGLELGLDASHAFAGEGGVQVCWDCALKRGGVFDEDADEWRVIPDLSGLPDERRPHA
ncbi:MAG: hypothetical protein AB1938_18245 [Myxococcota bacterium]